MAELVPTGDAIETPGDPWAAWRGRRDASRSRRDDKVAGWQENVTKRKGERAENASETPVNKDWPLTKAKISLLYSQTPEIRLTSKDPRAEKVIPQFAADLNDTIQASQVGAAIEEELADVVNASGISGVVIACEKRTETRMMPSMSPMVAGMSGGENPMMETTRIVDLRYPVRRLSPASLLIPAEFTGSVYDQAKWLGYDDSMSWATATVELGLTDEHKEKVLGADRKAKSNATLSTENMAPSVRENDVVNFTEIFYWRHYYHAEEKCLTALQRLVFVDGMDDPVIDEAYAGQKRLEDGRVAGVMKNPIQILTLTYISDENLPPSDSSISRHQVSELERSRSQMEKQRKHSLPINWFDTSRVSANTRSKIEDGTYLGYIPTNGPGDRAIGQVARSAFPAEKYELDQVIDREITDQWQVGPNQMGGYASGEKSAREAGIVERNFQTRIGQERAKVARHFVAIAEVLAGLMALHGKSPLPPELIGSMAYRVRVDSTVLLDAEQQIARLEKTIDRLAQSPIADTRSLVSEWLELQGHDPTKIIIQPQPKAPEPVKVSVSKAEDLNNPLFLAHLMRTGQGPSPEDLDATFKLLQEVNERTAAMLGGLPPPGAPPGTPMGPPPAAGGPDAPPPRDAETPGMANPDWQMAPRMDKRDVD